MGDDKEKTNYSRRWNDYPVTAKLGMELAKIATIIAGVVFLLKLVLGGFVVMKVEHNPVHQKIDSKIHTIDKDQGIFKEKLNNIEKGVERIEKKL